MESKESLFMKVGDTTAHECSDGVSQVEREYWCGRAEGEEVTEGLDSLKSSVEVIWAQWKDLLLREGLSPLQQDKNMFVNVEGPVDSIVGR